MSLRAQTHYERVERIVWTLDEAELCTAIRNHVLASKLVVPPGVTPHALEVELDSDDGSFAAQVTWRNVRHDATVSAGGQGRE